MQTAIPFGNYSFQLKNGEKHKQIFCLIRKKYVVFTPEEFVRQTVLAYLLFDKKIPNALINVEKMILVNGRKKRFDILVFKEAKVEMIIECKSPDVAINQTTFMQAAAYNLTLQANYFLLSNLKENCLLKLPTLEVVATF